MTRRSTETNPAVADPQTTTTTADAWLVVPVDEPGAGVPRERPGGVDAPVPEPRPVADHGAHRHQDARVPADGPDQSPISIVVAPAARTSATAAIALVMGVGALFSTATVLLAPLGVVLGACALALGIVGTGKAGRPHLTGRALAIGGIVTGVVGMLVGIAMVASSFTIFSDDGAVDFERRLGDVHIEISR